MRIEPVVRTIVVTCERCTCSCIEVARDDEKEEVEVGEKEGEDALAGNQGGSLEIVITFPSPRQFSSF